MQAGDAPLSHIGYIYDRNLCFPVRSAFTVFAFKRRVWFLATVRCPTLRQFAQFCIRTYATKVCESLQPAASCRASERTKFILRRDSVPDPAGELTTLPRPSSRMGRGIPSPHTTPLDAFGVCWFGPNLFFVPARLAID